MEELEKHEPAWTRTLAANLITANALDVADDAGYRAGKNDARVEAYEDAGNEIRSLEAHRDAAERRITTLEKELTEVTRQRDEARALVHEADDLLCEAEGAVAAVLECYCAPRWGD